MATPPVLLIMLLGVYHGYAKLTMPLGGSIEMIPNPVAVAELALEKGAATLLMPVSSRRQ